jgi:hypothetical protein
MSTNTQENQQLWQQPQSQSQIPRLTFRSIATFMEFKAERQGITSQAFHEYLEYQMWHQGRIDNLEKYWGNYPGEVQRAAAEQGTWLHYCKSTKLDFVRAID